jgi:cell division septal protein FtsQ
MKSRTNKHRKEVSSRDPIARYKSDRKRRGVTWSLILIFLLLLLLVVLFFFFPISRS